jgi:hypothetical protein
MYKINMHSLVPTFNSGAAEAENIKKHENGAGAESNHTTDCTDKHGCAEHDEDAREVLFREGLLELL